MTALTELGPFWLVVIGLVSFFLNGSVCIVVMWRQKKKTEFSLKEPLRSLRQRVRQLEEDLTSSQEEHRKLWSEVRKTIARLEFRAGGTSEHFQRPAMFGLDKKHQVCSLARQGLAADEISRKLNLYRGETELVLGLRKYGARAEKNDARSSMQ